MWRTEFQQQIARSKIPLLIPHAELKWNIPDLVFFSLSTVFPAMGKPTARTITDDRNVRFISATQAPSTSHSGTITLNGTSMLRSSSDFQGPSLSTEPPCYGALQTCEAIKPTSDYRHLDWMQMVSSSQSVVNGKPPVLTDLLAFSAPLLWPEWPPTQIIVSLDLNIVPGFAESFRDEPIRSPLLRKTRVWHLRLNRGRA
ncbi:hypothetical protein RRG08_022897 [Elysia crispata]|uniref:Uncharacterized protein n=1 Tax=Elysia crispata TaxID=231223 RepID=A0AAE0XP80_9GAST|nr:hypothetical protein RRG08_022897 [Elysia crispata]